MNWGFASTKQSEDVNQWCVNKIDRLFSLYEPDVIALENVEMKAAMRSSRVRRLAKQIEAFAAQPKDTCEDGSEIECNRFDLRERNRDKT